MVDYGLLVARGAFRYGRRGWFSGLFVYYGEPANPVSTCYDTGRYLGSVKTVSYVMTMFARSLIVIGYSSCCSALQT